MLWTIYIYVHALALSLSLSHMHWEGQASQGPLISTHFLTDGATQSQCQYSLTHSRSLFVARSVGLALSLSLSRSPPAGSNHSVDMVDMNKHSVGTASSPARQNETRKGIKQKQKPEAWG